VQQVNGSLGDFISDLESITTTGAEIATDPCLSQVVDLTKQFLASFPPAPPAPPGGAPPGFQFGGAGLCGAVTPLKFAIFVNQNRWVIPVGLFGIIALLVGAGYRIGKHSHAGTKPATAPAP
jgi:hypothetical protein